MTSQMTLGHVSHMAKSAPRRFSGIAEKTISQPNVVVKTKRLLLDNRKIARLKGSPDSTFNITMVLLACVVGTVVAIALYTKYYDSTDSPDDLKQLSNEPLRSSPSRSLSADYVDDFSDEQSIISTIVPISYLLRVAPDILSHVYSSRLTLTVACLRRTSHITFRSSPTLNVSFVLIQTARGDERVEVVRLTYSKNLPGVRLHLNTSLEPGHEYSVSVEYGGLLLGSGEGNGLFLKDYVDGEGVSRQLVLARHGDGDRNFMFPVLHYGEAIHSALLHNNSHARVLFQLIVQHYQNYSIISSIPLINTVRINSTVLETHFTTSLLPSRFAFIISEYSAENVSLIHKVRLHVPPGKSKDASTIKKIFQYFIRYLMKVRGRMSATELDVVTLDIGSTISFPGLLMLPENVLNHRDNTLQQMETSRLLLAKELVKQVFDCFSSRKSWLSEAVVLRLSYEMVSFDYPSWDMTTKFYLDVTNEALMADANRFTQAVLSTGEDEYPDHQGKVLKGTALIDMFFGYIGRSNSHKLIKELCERNESFEDDEILLRHLVTRFSQNDEYLFGKSVKTWFAKPGFPLLHLHRNGSVYSFIQSPFLPSVKKGTNAPAWFIPLSVRSLCNGTMYPILLTNQSETTWFPHCNVKVNSGGHGFYRLQYDDDSANTWVATLISNHKVLSAVDRANLISDGFEIARVEPEYIITALRFTMYLDKEHHYLPYTIAFQHLKRIVSLLSTTAKKCAKKYIERKVQPVFRYLNSLHRHSHIHRKLIGFLMKEAGGDIGEINRTLQLMFIRWVRSNGSFHIPSHLREAVFHSGVAGGSIYSWNFLFQYYQNKRQMNPGEKDLLLMGLANTPNDVLLKRLVRYPGSCVVTSVPCLQEKLQVWTHVCANQKGGKEMASEAFLGHWNHIVNKSSDVFPALKSFLLNCFGLGRHESDVVEIMQLKAGKLPGYLVRLLDVVTERIHQQIKFVNLKQKDVADWFKLQGC